MCKMLRFCRPSSRLKFAVRHATIGAEWRMVRTFIGSLDGLLPDRNFALFVEPRLPIGYPDCVLVEYDPDEFSSWSRERHFLSNGELKVLSVLSETKGLSADSVGRRIGLPSSKVARILRMLVENGDARSDDGFHYCAIRKGIRGVRRILSIEAKIGEFKKVVDQAALNRTFADESYVLMPERRISPDNRRELVASRVGMYLLSAEGRVRMVRRSPRRRSSHSYVSLYFNEWIGWRLLSERSRHGN